MKKKKFEECLFNYFYIFLIISFFIVDVWLIVASDLKDDRLMFISGILSLLVFLIAILIYIKQKNIGEEQNKKLKNEIINSTKFSVSKENEANILKESQDKIDEILKKN